MPTQTVPGPVTMFKISPTHALSAHPTTAGPLQDTDRPHGLYHLNPG